MNQFQIDAIKRQMEDIVRSSLYKIAEGGKNLPEFVVGNLLKEAAKDYQQGLKGKYNDMVQGMLYRGLPFEISQIEFDKMIDELTLKVLREFIKN